MVGGIDLKLTLGYLGLTAVVEGAALAVFGVLWSLLGWPDHTWFFWTLWPLIGVGSTIPVLHWFRRRVQRARLDARVQQDIDRTMGYRRWTY